MSGTGSRTNHQSRLDWWRVQFQRQQKANLSVALFCRQLGVSVASFYYWKRRVHEADSGTDSSRVSVSQRSGNPITSAGGTVANFVAMMNADAATLHMGRTHYSTPIGLDTPGDNYSTATDLAILARTVRNQPW